MRDAVRENAVIVDHLAFSVPLAEMRHLDRCGGELKKYWKSFPKRDWKNETNNERKERLIENWQEQYKHVCIERFSQFLSRIMNLRIGLPRDRGMHGYTVSYTHLTLPTSR